MFYFIKKTAKCSMCGQYKYVG